MYLTEFLDILVDAQHELALRQQSRRVNHDEWREDADAVIATLTSDQLLMLALFAHRYRHTCESLARLLESFAVETPAEKRSRRIDTRRK